MKETHYLGAAAGEARDSYTSPRRQRLVETIFARLFYLGDPGTGRGRFWNPPSRLLMLGNVPTAQAAAQPSLTGDRTITLPTNMAIAILAMTHSKPH